MNRVSCSIANLLPIGLMPIGLLIGQSNLKADDNFILQPKIQPTIVAVKEAKETPPAQNLVVQPPRPESNTTGEKAESPEPAVRAVAVPSPSIISALTPSALTPGSPIPGSPITGSPTINILPETQTAVVPPADIFRDADGLSWVKRGSLSASVSAVAKKPDNPPQPRLVSTIEIATPATAKAPQPSTQMLDQRPAPLVEKPSAPTSTMQWQNVQETVATTVSGPTQPTRAQLASRISKKIIGDSAPQRYLASSGSSLMGPAAVEQLLTEALLRSEQLCHRGVFMSAREEAKSAQLQLARYLDATTNSFRSEPAMNAAQVALREAADFSRPAAAKILHELISAHDTPTLKDVELGHTPPTALRQSYYQYAEEQLFIGAEHHPWFSDIFYTMGRTYQAEADSKSGDECELLRAQAVVYYRAATAIRPSNSLATNQLGYVLLQLDRPAEAMSPLVASVDAKLDAPALQNLAEASRRVGDLPRQRWALEQVARIRSRNQQAQPMGPQVIELDNSSFAATTPLVPYSAGTESRTANLPTGNTR